MECLVFIGNCAVLPHHCGRPSRFLAAVTQLGRGGNFGVLISLSPLEFLWSTFYLTIKSTVKWLHFIKNGMTFQRKDTLEHSIIAALSILWLLEYLIFRESELKCDFSWNKLWLNDSHRKDHDRRSTALVCTRFDLRNHSVSQGILFRISIA